MTMRLTSAAVVGYVVSLTIWTHEVGPDWFAGVFVPVSILLAAFIGVAVGRWWVLLLALLPTLVALPGGEDSDGVPLYEWALIIETPIFLAAILFGLVLRKVGDRRRRASGAGY
jgi:hypothetical protein